MQVGVVDLGEPLQRLAFHGDDRVDVALAQHFERDPRFDIQQMRLDPEPLEHVDRGHEGGGVEQVHRHRPAVELLHAVGRLLGEDMQFLVEHLGNVDELVADVVGVVLAFEIGQRVLAHDPGVDASRQQDIGHGLHRSAPHHRQNAKIGAVVEHRGKIGPHMR